MLKSLDLFGFKSFADKTAFAFSEGITGVVGPNGSGKSNVVDSIKWILGDQSAKSLRGKEMTDVIFNGASGRGGSAYAEATLTFDNASGFLPVANPEVQIGRRLWRNGDSEYLINRNAARLKDVRELFMGTGAGASAYCIIEQGRVDQILQANATNRRMVFEEAAGISRFKARKNEALRKLERVDQNLLRLTDIVDEVESQLNSIRSQAKKAATFRTVSNELRSLWIGLAADDFRRISTEQTQLEAENTTVNEQLAVLNSRQEELEQQLNQVGEQINATDEQLRAADSDAADARRRSASHDTTIRHETARLKEISSDLTRLRRQQQMMRVRVAEAEAELNRTRDVLGRQEHDFAVQQAGLDQYTAEINELTTTIEQDRRKIEDDREQILTSMAQTSEAGSRLTALRSQLEAAEQSQSAIRERMEIIRDRILERAAQIEIERLRVAAAEASVEDAENRIDSLRNDRQSLVGEQTQFQQTLAQLREERSAARARRAVLEDLEIRQEGVGIGVRDILKRAETMRHAPWNQIVGSVADLFDVDLNHAALLEVALGNRAQLIVVRRFEPLLDYFNSGKYSITGRVGFIAVGDAVDDDPAGTPANEQRPAGGHHDLSFLPDIRHSTEPQQRRRELPELKTEIGVIDRADRMISSAARVSALAEFLLSDTWIVETLDDALRLAQQHHNVRFVTLQGELLEPDGRLYVGTVRSESALVSRKSELRRLKLDLTRVDHGIADHQARLEQLDGSLTGLDTDMDAAVRSLQAAARELTEAEAALADQARQHQSLGGDEQHLQAELVGHVERASRLESQVRESEERLLRMESELTALRNSVQEAEQQIDADDRRLQDIEQKRQRDLLDLTKYQERVNSLRDGFQRLNDDRNQRQQQLAEVERRLATDQQRERDILLNTLNTSGRLAELALVGERAGDRAAVLRSERDQVRQLRAAISDQESAIRKQRRELRERQHDGEIRVRDIRHQIDNLRERIREEYQLELEECVEQGTSAYQLWLERLGVSGQSGRDDRDTDDDEDASAADVAGQVADAGDDDDAGTSMEADPDQIAADSLDDASILPPDDGPSFEQVRDDIQEEVNRLRRRLRKMGNVSTESLDNLEELETRFSSLSGQLQDLTEAKRSLEEMIRRINSESKRLFAETFDLIRGHFQDLFRKLFGGGDGDIILEDPDDILDCGIDVVARPPGKELRSISLLSGGERTMTAVALLLAIFKSRPSPFCILDEVDAALDDANITRFVNLLKEFQLDTQFIMITHRKPTMAVADVLYGVTMEESGVSKRLSVRFDDVNDNGEFSTTPDMQDRKAA